MGSRGWGGANCKTCSSSSGVSAYASAASPNWVKRKPASFKQRVITCDAALKQAVNRPERLTVLVGVRSAEPAESRTS